MSEPRPNGRMTKAQLVALAVRDAGMRRADADRLNKAELLDVLAHPSKAGGAGRSAAPSAPTPEPAGHESWDAFWEEIEREEAAERGEQATETIRGQEVPVPHDLPMRFDRRLDAVQEIERRATQDPGKFLAMRAELLAEREELNTALRDDTAEDTAATEALLARVERRIEDVDPIAATKALLRDLFGRDVLDVWVEEGMTEAEFQVVLLWGMAHGKGAPMTFREAYDAYREREQGKDAQPVPNRAEKRAAAKKKQPAATGGR